MLDADHIHRLILHNHTLLEAAEDAREKRRWAAAMAVETRLESQHIRKLAEALRLVPVPIWRRYLDRMLSHLHAD